MNGWVQGLFIPLFQGWQRMRRIVPWLLVAWSLAWLATAARLGCETLTAATGADTAYASEPAHYDTVAYHETTSVCFQCTVAVPVQLALPKRSLFLASNLFYPLPVQFLPLLQAATLRKGVLLSHCCPSFTFRLYLQTQRLLL